MKIDDVSALNADEQGEEDDISDPDEDTIAGQMAMMRGGSVKVVDNGYMIENEKSLHLNRSYTGCLTTDSASHKVILPILVSVLITRLLHLIRTMQVVIHMLLLIFDLLSLCCDLGILFLLHHI